MNDLNENYLNITDAKEWTCELWKITNDGSLQLRLFKPYQKGSSWVVFNDVLYFDCPRSWKSAQFQLGDLGSTLELFQSLRNQSLIGSFGDKKVPQHKLFQVYHEQNAEVKLVQILARECKINVT